VFPFDYTSVTIVRISSIITALSTDPSVGASERTAVNTYRFEPARDRPVLSLAPLCTRMVAAYQDRVGPMAAALRFEIRVTAWSEDPLEAKHRGAVRTA
jgi:hypothetical protein